MIINIMGKITMYKNDGKTVQEFQILRKNYLRRRKYIDNNCKK